MTHGTAIEERTHDVDLQPASSSTSQTKAVPQIDLPAEAVTIELTKDEYGFGFNVVGGSDSQHLPGDSGIFVSLVKEDGVAARDGRLHEGDKILAVNGIDLTDSTHDGAVKVLREIKMHAETTLVVLQNAELNALAHQAALFDFKQMAPIALSPFSRASAPAEDAKLPKLPASKEKESAALSFGAADTVSIKGALFGQGRKREDDEESVYAPSTHSIIDDVPRTPKKKKNLYERVTPLLTEITYVGIGLAALSAACFVVYKIVVRNRQ